MQAVLSDGNDLTAAKLTDHVRRCLATVRQMKLDMEVVDGRARSRKSSSFRRACSASEIIVIEGTVNQIQLMKKPWPFKEVPGTPVNSAPEPSR